MVVLVILAEAVDVERESVNVTTAHATGRRR